MHLFQVDIAIAVLGPHPAIRDSHLVAVAQGMPLGLGGLLQCRGNVFHAHPQGGHQGQGGQGDGLQQAAPGKAAAADHGQLVVAVHAGQGDDAAQQPDYRRQAHQLVRQYGDGVAGNCQGVVVEAGALQFLDETDQAEYRPQHQQHEQPALDQVAGDVALQDHRRRIQGCDTSTTSSTNSSAYAPHRPGIAPRRPCSMAVRTTLVSANRPI